MLSHFQSEHTEVDAGEEIDGETSILGEVGREHVLAMLSDVWILETLCQCFRPHRLVHFLHHNLDKDTTGRRSVVFVHLDGLENGPRNGITRQ